MEHSVRIKRQAIKQNEENKGIYLTNIITLKEWRKKEINRVKHATKKSKLISVIFLLFRKIL